MSSFKNTNFRFPCDLKVLVYIKDYFESSIEPFHICLIPVVDSQKIQLKLSNLTLISMVGFEEFRVVIRKAVWYKRNEVHPL